MVNPIKVDIPMENCSIKGCHSKEIAIDYLGKHLCDRCWNRFSEKPVDELRDALGLKAKTKNKDIKSG